MYCFNWAHVQGMTRSSVCLAYFQILLAQCWGCLKPATLIPISLRPAEYEDIYESKFPLTFSVTVKREDKDDLLQLHIDYDPTKLSVKSAERLYNQYRTLVDTASSEGKKVIAEVLDLLTPPTRDMLDRNQVQQVPIDTRRIRDLIEQRIRERSQRAACWFEADVKITYQELWIMVIVISELLLPYRAGRDGRVAHRARNPKDCRHVSNTQGRLRLRPFGP